MEIVGTIVGYLAVGSFILILLMLIFAGVLQGIIAIFRIIHMITIFILTIPAFIFNPKQFMEGYRLGKKHPYVDIQTMKLLEGKHDK